MVAVSPAMCLALCLVTVSQATQPATQTAPATRPVFEPIGLGGGGAMFCPASSPHDPNLLFVSCDMSGFYRSADGGRNWTMLDFRMVRGSTACRPVFHLKDSRTVYFDGRVSTDTGLTWTRLVRRDVGRIVDMAIAPDDDRFMLLGTEMGAWLSSDGGESWQRCPGVQGSVVGLYIEPEQKEQPRRVFIGTGLGIYRSIDAGRTFDEVREGLPWLQIRSFRGGVDQSAPATQGAAGGAGQGGRTVLYCTIPSRNVKGKFDGGVYKSVDGGATWRSAMGIGLNTRMLPGERGGTRLPQYGQLGVAGTAGRTVYVVCKGTGPQPPQHDTIYRSDDGGATWRSVYYPDPRDPHCNVRHGWLGLTFGSGWGGVRADNSFTVNPARPDVAMLATAGELFITTDGGAAWGQVYSRHAPGQDKPEYQKNVGRWESVGLEVTTTWNYDIDPFDPKRHYICYTDIGFAVSDDAGRTWHNNSRSSGTPWTNTTYMLAFDPKVKGKAWAAMSNVHDIPHWTYIHDKVKGPGGVCVSTDHCRTWRKSSEGLPEAPCTSIAIDPKSPADARVLYCTMFGHGVYKSIDGGSTWILRSTGLPEKNKHVFLVKCHPDGTLFACVTGRRQDLKFPTPGGLYRSRDAGDSWENVTATQPLHWPAGFDFDPKNSNVIYLAGATIPSGREGGLYKTTTGGASWTRLLSDEDFAGKGGPDYVQAMFVTLDPRNPDRVYLGTESQGLWHSSDAGRSWTQMEGVPFGRVQRVAFDPSDPARLYVTTFGGGVWRGIH